MVEVVNLVLRNKENSVTKYIVRCEINVVLSLS